MKVSCVLNIYRETMFLKSGKPERTKRNHLHYLNPNLRTLKLRRESYLPAANERLTFPRGNELYAKQTLWKIVEMHTFS